MTFVLDTSVLLGSGRNVFFDPEFVGEEVVIPLTVVRELESKRHDYELGLSARSVLRYLEELRTSGDLNKGVQVPSGPRIRIEVNHINTDLPSSIRSTDSADVRILSVAKSLKATLVSRDLPLRLIASTAGVSTRDYIPQPRSSEDYDKVRELAFDQEMQEELFRTGSVRTDLDIPTNANLLINGNALAVSRPGWEIKRVGEHTPYGIVGKNAEQRFALEHLMNPDVTMVSLGGRAGSGKTLLALAAGMKQAEDRGGYNRVVVFRSIHEVGFKEMGSLPGDIDEKFGPFTDAVFDATEQFMTKPTAQALIRNGRLEILPVNYVRGRTFNNTFILVDEAQNLEYSSLLTLLTRVGRGSKIVLASDISQSDNLHVSRHSGISEVVSRLYGHKLFAHVHMTKSHRSETAEAVANLLAI